jgi:hypothetical protein
MVGDGGRWWETVGDCGRLWETVGDGGRWWAMVGDCARWWETVGDCGRLWEMVGDGGRWWEMVGDGGRWWEMVGDGGRLWETVGDGGRWWEMVGDCGRWWEMVGDGGRWWEMVGFPCGGVRMRWQHPPPLPSRAPFCSASLGKPPGWWLPPRAAIEAATTVCADPGHASVSSVSCGMPFECVRRPEAGGKREKTSGDGEGMVRGW